MSSCYANSPNKNVRDSIDFVLLSSDFLDIIEDFSICFDDLYMNITQTNRDLSIDKQSHKKACSWLFKFDSIGDTLWIWVSLIDPFVKTIIQEHFIITEDMMPDIAYQGVSRDGTKVYIEASKLSNALFTPIGKTPSIDNNPSYFAYGLIVGHYYYYNNSFVEVPLIIEHNIDGDNCGEDASSTTKNE